MMVSDRDQVISDETAIADTMNNTLSTLLRNWDQQKLKQMNLPCQMY